MNIFLFVLLMLLGVGFLCATLIVAATVISGRAVNKLAQKHPTIYAEEALANAHAKAQAGREDAVVNADSTQVMTS